MINVRVDKQKPVEPVVLGVTITLDPEDAAHLIKDLEARSKMSEPLFQAFSKAFDNHAITWANTFLRK